MFPRHPTVSRLKDDDTYTPLSHVRVGDRVFYHLMDTVTDCTIFVDEDRHSMLRINSSGQAYAPDTGSDDFFMFGSFYANMSSEYIYHTPPNCWYLDMWGCCDRIDGTMVLPTTSSELIEAERVAFRILLWTGMIR